MSNYFSYVERKLKKDEEYPSYADTIVLPREAAAIKIKSRWRRLIDKIRQIFVELFG